MVIISGVCAMIKVEVRINSDKLINFFII
jgi:hypothetical protein